MIIPKFKKKGFANTKDLNSLIDKINKAIKITVRGKGTRATQGPGGVQVSIRSSGGGGGGAFVFAKTQEAAQADGQVSMKLWDGSAETGDAFDVYAWPDKRTTGTGREGSDMEEFGPHIFDEEVWPIYQVGDDWFLGVSFTYFGKYEE